MGPIPIEVGSTNGVERSTRRPEDLSMRSTRSRTSSALRDGRRELVHAAPGDEDLRRRLIHINDRLTHRSTYVRGRSWAGAAWAPEPSGRYSWFSAPSPHGDGPPGRTAWRRSCDAEAIIYRIRLNFRCAALNYRGQRSAGGLRGVVRPGITVWLDEAQMKVGHSLRRKIDEGIRSSRFGVVVLSEDFFRKGWTTTNWTA